MSSARLSRKKAILLLIGALLSTGFGPFGLKAIERAIMEEDFKTSEKLARDFIAAHKTGSEGQAARYYLGMSLLSQGRYDEAREAFGQIRQGEADTAFWEKSQIGVVDSFILAGEYEQALSRARQLLKQQPGLRFKSPIYLKIGRCYLKLARWGEARKYLNMIVKDFPDSLEAHLARQLLGEEQFFAVQIGSFLDRRRAENLMLQMTRQGEYAYIMETVDKTGQKFYRVRVGRFSQLMEAQDLEKRLSQLGFPTLIYP